jgi:hypothetical protein
MTATDLWEEWREPFSQHSMGLSEFPDRFLLVILNFVGDIDDGNLCIYVSLILLCCHRHLFPLPRLFIIAYICVVFKALLS